ncbi:beta-ketoacyl-ACP synthase [Oxalicibacterium solurbis]
MLYLNECGLVCALGDTHDMIKERMFDRVRSGVTLTDAWSAGRALPVGEVKTALPSMANWPVEYRSRNNALALAALAQIRAAVDDAIAEFGPVRIGIVIGTSTSGIAETEIAMRRQAEDGQFPQAFHYAQQEMGSPATMLATELGTAGPAYVQSSACSSSAKALASAARLLNMGVCDAVLCGGVDSMCSFTIAGFSALESVSRERCNPLSVNRNGINIGEGAALFLMTRKASAIALCGWGESSDGHHMSAPDPTGSGARLAIEQALMRAGVAASGIDYINMHGTATIQNDAMESRMVNDIFGGEVAVSSTKPLTGHALGAAAAIEAALCWLAMQDDNNDGKLPPHLWDGVADPALPMLNTVTPGMRLGRPLKHALSSSFAFGGSNAALVLRRSE